MLESFVGIIIWTFILEDVAIAGSFVLIAQDRILLPQAALACFIGISIGDLGLYALGLWARKNTWLGKFQIFNRTKLFLTNQKGNQNQTLGLGSLVFSCRFVPGTRVVTYLGAGLAGYSASRFFLITLVSVGLWVGLAFVVGLSVLEIFQEHWFLTILTLIFLFRLLRILIVNFSDPWLRRAYLPSYRQWLSFEFWPAWLFYIPVILNYIYLSIRYLNPLLPFYCNPGIHHSGMVGESKWDFLRHLKSGPALLKAFLVPASINQLEKIQDLIRSQELQYPFVLKPDIGQRGYAVRIVGNQAQLEDYLSLAKFNLIAQEFCDYQHEAGVFYIRSPVSGKPLLFSITDKLFPNVVGDGTSRIGDLILGDSRARIIAKTYFERFSGRLDIVPAVKEQVVLSNCGNHCQGAIFKNGKHLDSPNLLRSLHKVALEIPGFYIGRLDLRYRDAESFKEGREFKIVEVNGASSEATHIWDPETSLPEAYRVLFQQWDHVFRIGAEVKSLGLQTEPFNLWRLLKDFFHFQRPIDRLRVSS